MEVIITVAVFVLGLCAGSFVNMLLYRTAVDYKLIKIPVRDLKNKNRSVCDFCGKQLGWRDNIPVISWVVQKGVSRCCRKRLPRSYPVLELGTGIIFAVFYWQNSSQNPLMLILGLVMVTLLVFGAVFDIYYMILPDFSTFILIGLALLGVIFDEPNVVPYVAAAAGSTGFLLLLHILTKGKGMGMGDVKLAVFMGLMLGWPKIILAFYVAFIAGAVVGIIMLLAKKVKRNSAIAFGPFLILGTVAVWWWGDELTTTILRFW